MSIFNLMDKEWVLVLKEELNKPYMKELGKFLRAEYSKKNIYPPKNEIFKSFFKTPLSKVKAVIIGQDPYHGKNQANGLAFSVSDDVLIPPSLKNIFKELKDDLFIEIPKKGNLEKWAEEGVLLLNSTLTVREKEPKSHYNMGWEIFTDKIVEILANKEDPIVFLLWGKSAKDKINNVKNLISQKKHLILTAAHPSFYSAHNFFGCRHFSKTNEFLKIHNKKEINWQIS
ncbi:MAG: uracil-DNA glycosylase [Chlamydiae bacterium RIFCSPHIGHO2_12_FULL_27_8]|nr:MAG: uracil-DNA glycosylase [Chlamydiae bacterium RIFCSPHIGHO2_12_FULL_27_8]